MQVIFNYSLPFLIQSVNGYRCSDRYQVKELINIFIVHSYTAVGCSCSYGGGIVGSVNAVMGL